MQMVVARTTENMMGRVVASDLVASDMIPQIMGYRFVKGLDV